MIAQESRIREFGTEGFMNNLRCFRSGSVNLRAFRIRIHYSEVWNRILPSSSKKSKKNLDFWSFVSFYNFLSLKNDVPVYRITLLEGYWRKEQDPDPYQVSRFRNPVGRPKIRTSYRRLLITKEESDRAEERVRIQGGGIVCSDAVLLLAVLTPDCCCCCGSCCWCCCCSLWRCWWCFCCWYCCCCSCWRCCCCWWAASSPWRVSLEGGAGLEKLLASWLWPVLP